MILPFILSLMVIDFVFKCRSRTHTSHRMDTLPTLNGDHKRIRCGCRIRWKTTTTITWLCYGVPNDEEGRDISSPFEMCANGLYVWVCVCVCKMCCQSVGWVANKSETFNSIDSAIYSEKERWIDGWIPVRQQRVTISNPTHTHTHIHKWT